MKIVKDETVYGDKTFPHTYALTDERDRLLGYRKASSGEIVVYAKPLRFYTKGRTLTRVTDLALKKACE